MRLNRPFLIFCFCFITSNTHAYLCPDLTPHDIVERLMIDSYLYTEESQDIWTLYKLRSNGRYSLLVLGDEADILKKSDEVRECEHFKCCEYLITDRIVVDRHGEEIVRKFYIWLKITPKKVYRTEPQEPSFFQVALYGFLKFFEVK